MVAVDGVAVCAGVGIPLARDIGLAACSARFTLKTQINNAWSASLSDTLDHEADMQSLAFVSDDLKEGARAFLEKRPPAFRGC